MFFFETRCRIHYDVTAAIFGFVYLHLFINRVSDTGDRKIICFSCEVSLRELATENVFFL